MYVRELKGSSVNGCAPSLSHRDQWNTGLTPHADPSPPPPPPATTTSSRSTLTQGDAARTTSVTSGSLGVSVGWPSTTGNSLMVSLAHHTTYSGDAGRGGDAYIGSQQTGMG